MAEKDTDLTSGEFRPITKGENESIVTPQNKACTNLTTNEEQVEK